MATNTTWYDDPFTTEARKRKLNHHTISILQQHNYASEEALANLETEFVESLNLGGFQTGALMNWVSDIRQASVGGSPPHLGPSSNDPDRRHPRHFNKIRHTATPTPSQVKPTTNDLTGKHVSGSAVRGGQTASKVISVEKGALKRISSSKFYTADSEGPALIAKAMQNMNVSQMMDTIDDNVVNFLERDIDIAVCGRSGTGKSSLVNCILNLRAGDDGAAKVNVTECTIEIEGYKNTAMPRVVIWDLPGLETRKYPKDTYLESVGFSNFDAFIIVCGNRVFEDDTWLAREAQKLNKPFYFVRSKIDQELLNAKDDGIDEMQAFGDIKQNAQESLREVGMGEGNVFLVSSKLRYQTKWEYPELVEELIHNTPNRNATALIMAMVSCSLKIIQNKKRDFAERIKLIVHEAIQPGASYKTLIINEMKMYVDHFGVSDTDLSKWQVEIDNISPELKEIKSDLTCFILDSYHEKEKELGWRLANNKLFRRCNWAKNLAEKIDDKHQSRVGMALSEAQKETSEIIGGTTRETLRTALDSCYDLAIGIWAERNKLDV